MCDAAHTAYSALLHTICTQFRGVTVRIVHTLLSPLYCSVLHSTNWAYDAVTDDTRVGIRVPKCAGRQHTAHVRAVARGRCGWSGLRKQHSAVERLECAAGVRRVRRQNGGRAREREMFSNTKSASARRTEVGLVAVATRAAVAGAQHWPRARRRRTLQAPAVHLTTLTEFRDI